jgi:hypothetical protein
MKGCLITIVGLVLVMAAAAWFVLPPLAGTVAEGALVAAGFDADTSTVTVESDPPLKLLTLNADTLRIQATNVAFRGVEAASADITLSDVAVIDRSFQTLKGTLKGVRFKPEHGAELGVPLVQVSGTPDKVRATLDLPAADAEALAVTAVEDAVGITPSSVVFAAPDRVRVTAGSLIVNGRLALKDDGSLVLVAPSGSDLGSVELVSPGVELPVRVESFKIVDGGLILVATVDPGLG